jgi:lipocalin-like protein
VSCRAATVVLCALVAGCGGGGNEFPTGNWEANVLSTAGKSAPLNPRVLRARAEYRADGTWEFFYRFEDGGWTQTTSGTYSTTEDTISFEADSDCAVQRPHVEQGTYAWALDDKGRLILNAQYDPCPARVEDLDGNAYTRVGPPPEP